MWIYLWYSRISLLYPHPWRISMKKVISNIFTLVTFTYTDYYLRFPRILNLFIVLNLAYLQKENTFNVGFFSYPNLKWRISIRGSERKLIYRLRTSEWEEIRFESGKMKLILESIFLIGSVISETCSYLDSSVANNLLRHENSDTKIVWVWRCHTFDIGSIRIWRNAKARMYKFRVLWQLQSFLRGIDVAIAAFLRQWWLYL